MFAHPGIYFVLEESFGIYLLERGRMTRDEQCGAIKSEKILSLSADQAPFGNDAINSKIKQ